MQITDVRIRKVEKEGKMRAVVSITIDEEFVVHDIKVIEGEKGLFIAMPSRRAADGEYRDIAHPINSQTRESIQRMILDKYQEEIEVEAEKRVFLLMAETPFLCTGAIRKLLLAQYVPCVQRVGEEKLLYSIYETRIYLAAA